MPLKTGDPLPEGVDWPKGPLVVYFYPKDFTGVCTKEACEFRDIYDTLKKDFGAEVIGVSRDSDETHERFKAEHRLPFRLIADRGGKLSKAFGVERLWGLIPFVKRVTFVADAGGVIRGVFHHELDAARHVRDVRETLSALAKGP
ncbi:MAG TPA: peroxiredoxin [Planctomycetota bacterium]